MFDHVVIKTMQFLCNELILSVLDSKHSMHVYISCCIHTYLLHSGMQACQRGRNAFICGVQFLSKKQAHMKRCSSGTYIPL